MTKNKNIQRALAAPKAATGKLGKTPPINIKQEDGKYEIDYFHFHESLYRKEVTDWINARASRRDPFNPITFPIIQLYKDSLLDNHLSGAIEQRILRVVNKQYVILDPDEKIDKDRTKTIKKKWLRHLVRKAMESKFQGYSCVFISDAGNGKINQIKDINRENVIPERGVIIKNAMNPSGERLNMGDFPNHIIYIQLLPEAVGILERIAPMTIFKRHSWASWDDFEQIFGVPIRIAKTTIDTKKHKDDLQLWLETMGTSSYGIFDKRVDLEIKENNRADAHKVFSEKVGLVNKEMSKGVLLQTMTMDDGSSQSQAEVHMEILEEVTDADITDVEDWLNDELLPVLRVWGFDIPEGYTISIKGKSRIKPKDKIAIDKELLNAGYNLTTEYVESTYDVQLDQDNPRTEAGASTEPATANKKQSAEDLPSFFD